MYLLYVHRKIIYVDIYSSVPTYILHIGTAETNVTEKRKRDFPNRRKRLISTNGNCLSQYARLKSLLLLVK